MIDTLSEANSILGYHIGSPDSIETIDLDITNAALKTEDAVLAVGSSRLGAGCEEFSILPQRDNKNFE